MRQQFGPERSLREVAVDVARRACAACGYGRREREILDVLGRMTVSWGDRRVGDPLMTSGVTHDATPFEVSIAIDPRGVREFRLSVEPQGPLPASGLLPDLRANWSAFCALVDDLAASHGIVLDRFAAVRSDFEPRGRVFTTWAGITSVIFREDEPPAFKIYMNPEIAEANGVSWPDFVAPLGVGASVASLGEVLSPRDTVPIFSLDLVAGKVGRVKVYVVSPGSDSDPADLQTVRHIERLACLDSEYRHGDVESTLRTMAPEIFDGGRSPIAILSHMSLTERDVKHFTLQTSRHFAWAGLNGVEHLLEPAIAARTVATLRHFGLDTTAYRQLFEAIAGGPPEADERYVHTCVTMKRAHGEPLVTVYFDPVFYGDRVPRFSPGGRERAEARFKAADSQ